MTSSPSSRDAYNVWHERYEVDREAATPWHRLLVQHLDAERDLKGRRVLEIACGRGGFAGRLARMTIPPPRLVAADFSSAAVRKAHAFVGQASIASVTCAVSDAQSLPHPDASFDTVISCETIEHLPDAWRAVREFARVLKPGGRLFLTCPNYLGPMGLYRMYARIIGRPYTEEGQPINRLTMLPCTVRQLRRAGLRVVLATATGHYLPLPGRPPRELRALEDVGPLRWLALHSLTIAQKPQ